MKRYFFGGLAAVILILAVAARLNNAWVSPVLAGYDAFGHFTYIWFLSETGRVPLPTHGWSFFHPPLYYASMAALWNALASLDPVVRLKTGKLLIAALGCIHAGVAWHVVGRHFPNRPNRRRVQVLAAALPLVVPVQLYSIGFLGNESLLAVLGSVSLLALLRVLDSPTIARAAVLGLCLGLAMLTKFTAIVIVAGALATIALKGIVQRGRGSAPGAARASWSMVEAARVFAIVTVVMLVTCGGYYARNVLAYGTPFQLSRTTFMVAYVEDNQPRAARGWADYLTFDPLIFRRPVWPRGQSALEDHTPHTFERAMRESVWTGLYANTWFDGFGGWVLPLVTESERARRAGQALMTLGLVPTILILVGVWSALAGVRRRGWDDTVVAFALVTASMFAVFVYGTRQAPISAAVKATYLTPVSVCFAFWFAHGLVHLQQWRPHWTAAVDSLCAILAVLCLAVFWQGLLFDPTQLGRRMPRFADGTTTQVGIVEYAGGNVAGARRAFEQAAASNYHLAWENLGFLAIDEGNARKGLRLLRRAAALQRVQVDGGPIGRERFAALAEAEYDHSIAVVLHGLGRIRRAQSLWERALAGDPEHAEARWCLSLSRLEEGLRTASDGARRRAVLDGAARSLEQVRTLDPGLKQGWQLAIAVEALRGDCDSARRLSHSWRALPWWIQRRFPAETGTGTGLSASIGRRRLLTPQMPELSPSQALLTCNAGVD